MPSRRQVERAYQLILGRAPENEDAFGWVNSRGLDVMISGFLSSEEFRSRSPHEQASAVAAVDAGMLEW